MGHDDVALLHFSVSAAPTLHVHSSRHLPSGAISVRTASEVVGPLMTIQGGANVVEDGFAGAWVARAKYSARPVARGSLLLAKAPFIRILRRPG